MNDEQIEKEIEEKRLTAPRVTLQMIEDQIDIEHYDQLDATTVTVCCLHLKSGFTVVGTSACVSEANFDEEIGRKIARQNALDKCWELFGFHLSFVLSGVKVL